MAHGVLLPVSSGAGQCSYEGYIAAKGGFEYHIKLTIPSGLLKDARVDCDWRLKSLLRGHEDVIQKRLAESSDLDQFLLELKTIVQRQECNMWWGNGDNMSASCYSKLMADLEELGWTRVVYVSPELTTLKISTQDSHNNEHIVTLTISSQYPSRPPLVSAYTPLAFTPHWNYPGPEGTLLALVQQFERWLVQFEVLWGILDEVDSKCWVLEPEKPSRACTFRRIVIGDNLSLHMVLAPSSPTSPPQLTFLGADQDVLPLISKWNSSLHTWSEQVSLLDNLRNILSVTFPPPPSAAEQEEGEECAICYAYRWDGHAPSVVCGNRRCRQVFHNQCLYEWLRSLQTVTKFNKIAGECPNCGQSISTATT